MDSPNRAGLQETPMTTVLRPGLVLPLLLLAACKGQAPDIAPATEPAAAKPTTVIDPVATTGDPAELTPRQKVWQRCKMTVDAEYTHERYQQTGTAGYDALLKERCGPPVNDRILADIAGLPPVVVVQSPPWNTEFSTLLGGALQDLVDGLELAAPTVAEGDWVTGSGVNALAPDSAISAFAINRKTRQILAVTYQRPTDANGDTSSSYRTYGFSIADDGQLQPDGVSPPPAFRQWLQETIYDHAN